jgi:SRSO17 transposase
MTECSADSRPFLEGCDDLSTFCDMIFGSMPRSDQRRWGEIYLRGLLSVPGRKSIRRIAEAVVGRPVDQSLQQFVNQSPWRWDEVRRALARRAAAIRPRAWLVHEAAFPKNGDSSVAVAKQYVASAGRTLNCQLGLVVFLAGAEHRWAVNWRLTIPKCWDEDPARRSRARVPDGERSRPRWRYLLDAVDEMAVEWGLSPAPVVTDSVDGDARPLLRGLAERRMSYVVRVSEHAPVLVAATGEGEARMLTAGELAELSVRRRQVVLRTPDRFSSSVQYSVLTVCDACPAAERVHLTSACQHHGTRRVLAEWSWSPAGSRLRSVWLTNLTTARLPQLVGLVGLSLRARESELNRLRDEFGLQDFEGRSFAGWHHHVTLVSAAHAFRTLPQIANCGLIGAVSTTNLRWRVNHGDQNSGAAGGRRERQVDHADGAETAAGVLTSCRVRRAAGDGTDNHRGTVGNGPAALGDSVGTDVHLAAAATH